MNHEKKLGIFTNILCIIIFTQLSFLGKAFDYKPLIILSIIVVFRTYGTFIIRKFYTKGDKFILNFITVFSTIGIALIYRVNESEGIKQLIWFTVGVTTFIVIVILFNSLSKFRNLKILFLILTLVFMSMSFIFGSEVMGSRNWIQIGSFGFQPSEIGKIFLIFYLASSLKDYKTFKDLFQPAILVAISLGFMLLQKDLGSALIFFAISVTMLYIATGKLKYIAFSFSLFAIGSLISYKLFDHLRIRIMIWLDPWAYANNESLQVVQSLFAISSGGFFGVGLGNGYPELIPVVTRDMIFAIICEEFGSLVGLGIIILYFLLFYRCMRAAIYVKDSFLRLLSIGFSTMLAAQTIVIVGGTIGMLPLTGITLPFISYGGSSVVTLFFALGIIQKISEEEKLNG